MNSKQHYSKIKTFLPCLLFAFISFGITCYSSTLLRVTSCPHQDSYAYRYIGMLIAKGGMPYLDAFDNKGPVLYIINWLGYLISKSFGVYLFELLFIFLFFLESVYQIVYESKSSKKENRWISGIWSKVI